MNLQSTIFEFAKENSSFHLEKLLVYLFKSKSKFTFSAVSKEINKMISEQALDKLDDNQFKFLKRPKLDFEVDQALISTQICSFLHNEFPFAKICVWNAQDLVQFMQHIPSINFLIVEVDKDAVASVAERLHRFNSKIILKNPSQSEINRFITSKDVVVVKNLVSQSPLSRQKNLFTPKIEKILVDILCDDVFYMLNGMETEHFYQNALTSYIVDERKLKRYASRRNKLHEVESLLERCR